MFGTNNDGGRSVNGSLSVVIPNYNNSRFITQCVESIINQTYPRIIEIIIVDDCSTDDSRKVITKLSETYVIQQMSVTLLRFFDIAKPVSLIYCLLGMGIGMLGSSMSMKKYLEV